MTAEERGKLLLAPNRACPTGQRNYCMIMLCCNLGLRVSELLSIKVSDIDWLSGRVYVHGKGQRDRVLWLSAEDLQALRAWKEIHAGQDHGRLLFCTLAGGPLQDRYVRAMVKRYAARAAIEKRVHPHSLRHTFATDLLKQTKNIRLVQKALGHASLNTTMIYTHVVDDELQDALIALRG